MKEVFKKINQAGCESYEVSNYGRIRNTETGKIYKVRTGGSVHLTKISKHFVIGRLVVKTFLFPNLQDSHIVRYIDGNPKNGHINNLQIFENKSMHQQFLIACELMNHPSHVLESIITTTKDYKNKFPKLKGKEISKIMGVSEASVSNYLNS